MAYTNERSIESTDNSDSISAAIETSNLRANPAYSRRGLDANGLTAEEDARYDQFIQKTAANIENPELKSRIVGKMIEDRMSYHDANAKYEMAEVYKGSIDQIKTRFDDEVGSLTALIAKKAEAQRAYGESVKSKGTAVGNTTDGEFEHEFDETIDTDVNKRLKTMHQQAFMDYRNLGFSEDEAYAAASKQTSECFKGVIGNLLGGGMTVEVNGLLKKKELKTATLVPVIDEKTGKQAVETKMAKSKDGKDVEVVVTDKDGNPVLKWDETKYDPSGTLWCKQSDIGKMREDWQATVKKAKMDANAKLAINEDGIMLDADKLNTAGLSILSNPDSTYNPDELNVVLYGGIVNGKKIAGLNELALTAPTSKAARHVNSIIKDLQEKAKQMSRRVKNWDEKASSLKTTADYLALLYDTQLQGNVGGLTALTYGGQAIKTPANIDCQQKMIAIVKNGIARGKLKKEEYGEEGTSEYSLKNLRKEFGRTNWNEAAQWLYRADGDFCGGKIEIDMDRTKAMYLGALREKGETDFKNQVEKWEMDQYKFSGIWEVNQETGERTLPDAKYYWFKYTTPDGKVIHLSGDDMEVLSRGVHEFQTRNSNPSDRDDGNTHSFIKGIFESIVTRNAMRVGSGADTTLKRGAMSQIVGENIREYYNPSNPHVGVNAHTVRQIQEDFDPFVQATERADFSPMYNAVKAKKQK